jgi:hypothetical protein
VYLRIPLKQFSPQIYRLYFQLVLYPRQLFVIIITYLKLVGEDIRLLRFNNSLALDHPSEPLRLSLEKFSLNNLSEDFMSHANSDQPRQTWNNTFSRNIEYRRAALNAHHNAPQRIPSVVQSSTRFTWGNYEALSYT